MGLGQQLLGLGVLTFQLRKPLGVGHVHPAELGAPFVKGGIAETTLAAQLLDRQAGLVLLDEPDDLLFGLAGTAGKGQVKLGPSPADSLRSDNQSLAEHFLGDRLLRAGVFDPYR